MDGLRWAAAAGLAAAVFAASPTPAAAQGGAMQVCREDVARLCAGIPRGGGAIARCLAEHESELSGACREQLSEHRERREQVRAACADDAQRLCPDSEPGRGLARCLEQHRAELDDACREALPERQGRRRP